MGILIFPLLLIPALIYAMMAIPSGDKVAETMAAPAFSMPLASGAHWVVTWGHVIVIIAVITLFFEILKSTRPSSAQLIDNGLSVGVFIVTFVLWLLIKPFGTTEFFIIVLMALLDFLSGSVIMTRVSQRTVQYDQGH